MSSVYEKAMEFKRKYPFTIAWRIRKHSTILEKHLNEGEEILYAFPAQKNDSLLNIVGTAVVALTSERILIARDRLVIGYFLDSITPDLFNDLKIRSGILWGKVDIDTVKEMVQLSNLDPRSLVEIETNLSEYLLTMKPKFVNKDEKTSN